MKPLKDQIEDRIDVNLSTKRNRQKFVSKLRRWQTKGRSRSERVKLLEKYPCIIVGGVVVK